MALKFLNVKKNQKNISWHMKSTWNTHFIFHKLEESHIVDGGFLQQWQSSVVRTEPTWFTTPTVDLACYKEVCFYTSYIKQDRIGHSLKKSEFGGRR